MSESSRRPELFDAPRDDEYQAWSENNDRETREALDIEHHACTPDNPFGMCNSCRRDYEATIYFEVSGGSVVVREEQP